MMVMRKSGLMSMILWGVGASLILGGCGFFDREVPEVVVPESAVAIALESPAFEANGRIPSTYTCDGEDISPELRWDGVPEEALSLVLIMDDPDAPRGTFVHWVLYDIPTEVEFLPENFIEYSLSNRFGSRIPSVGGYGKNDFGTFFYRGPCPPSGTHRYVFKLYALDTFLGTAGGSKADVVKAMDEHIVGFGEVTGTYTRP
jgi:Raf kinase inhibitor-like YbhB/YbcL family protein